MADYQGEKFKEFLLNRRISVSNAAKMMSVSRQNVYQYFKTASLSRDTVNAILVTFNVKEEEIWGTKNETPQRLEAKPISLSDPDGDFRTGDKIYELPDGQKVMEVKIVPVKAQAGYMRGFPDPEYYEDLPTLTIPVNGYHRGTYLAFEVQGDSMTPSRMEDVADSILEGWHVVGRELPRHRWEYKLHTHSHSYWIIVHKSKGILIKQITEHNVDNGTITIHSLNPAYEDEILELKDIDQIFSGIKRIINDR